MIIVRDSSYFWWEIHWISMEKNKKSKRSKKHHDYYAHSQLDLASNFKTKLKVVDQHILRRGNFHIESSLLECINLFNSMLLHLQQMKFIVSKRVATICVFLWLSKFKFWVRFILLNEKFNEIYNKNPYKNNLKIKTFFVSMFWSRRIVDVNLHIFSYHIIINLVVVIFL